MKILHYYVSFMDKVNRLLLWFVGILLFVIFALLVSQVFSRYILNSSLSWTDEAARYLVIWVVFLGTSLSLRNKSLIAVEAVIQFIPQRGKRVFKMMVLALSILFAVYLLVLGIEIASQVAYQRSIALGLPMWIPYAAIPVGAVYIILNALVLMVEIISEEVEG